MSFFPDEKPPRNGKTFRQTLHLKESVSAEHTAVAPARHDSEGANEAINGVSPDVIAEKSNANLEPLNEELFTVPQLLSQLIQEILAYNSSTVDLLTQQAQPKRSLNIEAGALSGGTFSWLSDSSWFIFKFVSLDIIVSAGFSVLMLSLDDRASILPTNCWKLVAMAELTVSFIQLQLVWCSQKLFPIQFKSIVGSWLDSCIYSFNWNFPSRSWLSLDIWYSSSLLIFKCCDCQSF